MALSEIAALLGRGRNNTADQMVRDFQEREKALRQARGEITPDDRTTFLGEADSNATLVTYCEHLSTPVLNAVIKSVATLQLIQTRQPDNT